MKITGGKKGGLPLALMIILGTAAVLAAADVRKVKTLEFKGLVLLSRYEVIERAQARMEGGSILINVDSLKRALADLPLVKSFSITERDGSLVITVSEREPAFLLAMKREKQLVPFELDERFQLLSVRKVHAAYKPLIIVPEREIRGGRLSVRLRDVLLTISSIERTMSVGREIAQIDLSDMERAKLFLKGRKTEFILKPDRGNFTRLQYAAGYLDSLRYYPGRMQILDGSAVMK